jgi:hypothetical protein
MNRRTPIWSIFAFALAICLLAGTPVQSSQTSRLPDQLSDAEFWRIVTEFSEPSGDYAYQNFVSNEITIQRIIPPTKRAIKPGGVFIGVGPEQNFTYASALQSRMAFVVDIRRQNMILHLMYKALFEMSSNRAEFMTNLFSRPRPSYVDERTNVAQTFDLFLRKPADPAIQTRTAAAIKATLARHGFNLSPEDLAKIDYIQEVFYKGGPNISYDFMSESPPTGIPYPTYQVLMNSTDATGQNWSFLATEDNYQFVREMQRKNMIVPLVGDFAGPKALRSIAEYLKAHNSNVAAFYISNVELYLNPQQLQTFYASVAAMPHDGSGILMRFVNHANNAPMSWWKDSMTHQSVVSRISDLASQVKAGTPLRYPAILAPLKDPATIDVP